VSDSNGHMDGLYRVRARLSPPLRPNEEVIAAYRHLLARRTGRVLLLGVTPALADIGAEVEAVDDSKAAIARGWPGDTERRRVHKANWLSLPFPARRFTSAVGDGALNSLGRLRDYPALFAEIERVVEPGGLFVTRVFARPATCEPVATVVKTALAGEIPVFSALKWRLAMALVAESGEPEIEVRRIKDVFDALFPDRAALAAAARWELADIETIDVYAGSRTIYNFPTLAEIRATVPSGLGRMRVVPAGTYPLAERCPLLVFRLKVSR